MIAPATKTVDDGGRHVHTPQLVEIGTRQFTMTAPTQTNLGTVYVMDNPVMPTVAPTCNPGSRIDGAVDTYQCRVEQCMWNNWIKPINITTAVPVAT